MRERRSLHLNNLPNRRPPSGTNRARVIPVMKRIAVLSTDSDLTWLSDGLRKSGFSCHPFRFPHNATALRGLVRRLDTSELDALVYDLEAPSSARVEMFRVVRSLGVDLPSLILTSEPELLYRLLGPMAVYDVVLE